MRNGKSRWIIIWYFGLFIYLFNIVYVRGIQIKFSLLIILYEDYAFLYAISEELLNYSWSN